MNEEPKSDFDLRPNSQVRFESAEKMHEYQQGLLLKCLRLLHFEPRIIQHAGEFPYTIRAGVALQALTALQTFMVNLAAQQWVLGIVEDLHKLEKLHAGVFVMPHAELDEYAKTLQARITHYEQALRTLQENSALLETELSKGIL